MTSNSGHCSSGGWQSLFPGTGSDLSALCRVAERTLPPLPPLPMSPALCGIICPGSHSAPGSENSPRRGITEKEHNLNDKGYSDLMGILVPLQRLGRKTGKTHTRNARLNPDTYKMPLETCLICLSSFSTLCLLVCGRKIFSNIIWLKFILIDIIFYFPLLPSLRLDHEAKFFCHRESKTLKNSVAIRSHTYLCLQCGALKDVGFNCKGQSLKTEIAKVY